MLKNYLIIAIRNFYRHKLYSFINVCGLAIGLACAIVIGLYVREELSFDRFWPNSDNLYRIGIIMKIPGQSALDFGAASAPLGPAIKEEIPGVVDQTRLLTRRITIYEGNRQFSENVNLVDANFFFVFRQRFVSGSAETALRHPDDLVLTQTAAYRLFGDADPIGKTIRFEDRTIHKVSAVLSDFPHNTQFKGDVFVLYVHKTDASNPIDPEHWTQFDVSSYVRLASGTDPNAVASRIPDVFLRHLPSAFITEAVRTLHADAGKLVSGYLVPIRDVHLSEHVYGGGMTSTNRPRVVYGISCIALLILIIAGFNYTNLATARATLRAREVGLRKVLGAGRRLLVQQFLTESVCVALVSVFLALALSEVLLPLVSDFLGYRLSLAYFADIFFIAGMFGLAVLIGLAGGLYPAFALSAFRPVDVLRSSIPGSVQGGKLRTLLVVVQFSISIGLGIVVLVVFSQLNYAQKIDLGFDRDNIVSVDIYDAGLSDSKLESMRKSLTDTPSVLGTALSDKVPGSYSITYNFVQLPGHSGNVSVNVVDISPEFPALYGMKLLAGRFLSRDYGSDTHFAHGSGVSDRGYIENGHSILIDENAARALGYAPDDAVGKTVGLMGGTVHIVGVVRHMLFFGVNSVQVAPTIYYYNPSSMLRLSVKLKGGQVTEGVAALDATWRRYVPEQPISRAFIGERMNALYVDTVRQGTLLVVFVFIAIFIACLGLFGLAAFTVAQRTREIGIRKVFGARRRDIVRLLLWRFSIPVLIANLIAWPVAGLWSVRWLEGYAYHVHLSPLYFLSAGGGALLIAWVTVAAHAYRTARTNPIAALRAE